MSAGDKEGEERVRCVEVFRVASDMGTVCVGYYPKPPEDVRPDDHVSLCIGKFGREEGCRHQIVMTLEEAEQVGMALIRVRMFHALWKMLQEKVCGEGAGR
jgi:hypothetical protein